MSITYLDVRESAIKQIKEKFKNHKIHIEAHPGSFDENEIKRLVTKTPAILTSLMKITDRSEQDESECEFISWVLYRASTQDKLYDGIIKTVSALIPVIRNLDDEFSYNGGVNITAESLYSGTLDKINITLWAVRWRWMMRAVALKEEDGEFLFSDDLEYFEGYGSKLKVGKRIAKDNVNLEVNKNGNTNETNP